MLKVLVRCGCILALTAIVCAISTAFFILPTEMGLEVALGQLENSDANFAALQAYNHLRNIGFTIDGIAATLGFGWIGVVLHKYFRNK